MAWIGVDLDRTLAHFSGHEFPSIGPPIPAMVARVRHWLAQGHDVRIFTARVAHAGGNAQQTKAIQQWCLQHLGRVLPVTNSKDMSCIAIYDDIAHQVEPNTGRVVGEQYAL